MTKTTLRRKIVNCVEHIDDEKILEAIYTLLNVQIENNEYELSKVDIAVIDARKKAILKGEEKIYTVAEAKNKLLKNLKK